MQEIASPSKNPLELPRHSGYPEGVRDIEELCGAERRHRVPLHAW